MEINSLHELYIDQLRDLYDAENQLIDALPKMAKSATSDELREGIEEHHVLEQTKNQAQRLGIGRKKVGRSKRFQRAQETSGLVR